MLGNNAAQDLFHEAIKEAYIKPIRNIVFIDDMYKTYHGLLNGTHTNTSLSQDDQQMDGEALVLSAESKEEDALLNEATSQGVTASQATSAIETSIDTGWPQDQAVIALIDECEEEYLSYFDNSPNPKPGILTNADLVVLDYILDPKTKDSTYCLNILRQLNKSHKMSLVVLYTLETPETVIQELTIGLRGYGRKLASTQGSKATISDEQRLELLSAYLAKDDGKLQISCTRLGITEELEAVHKCLEDYIKSHYKSLCPASHESNVLECGFEAPEHPWIRGDKLFVTALQKDPHNPLTKKMIIDHVTSALCKYHPSPVSIIAQTCINNLVQESPKIIDELFDSRETKAAILFHALTHDNPIADSEGTRAEHAGNELVQFIMEAITIPASQAASKQALKIFGELFKSFSQEKSQSLTNENEIQNACLDFALKEELALPHSVSKEEPKTNIFKRLNATLCSHNDLLNFVTTGTVFVCGSEHWVCTSPSCDLVPGRNGSQGSYKRELYPANYFYACRLTRIETTASKDISKSLQDATSGQYIFIRSADGTDQVFLVLSKDGKPTPHIFYSATSGLLDSAKKITLHKTKFNEEKNDFEVSYEEAEVIAQLRPAYASKILQHFGLYNSRIGVDFRSTK